MNPDKFSNYRSTWTFISIKIGIYYQRGENSETTKTKFKGGAATTSSPSTNGTNNSTNDADESLVISLVLDAVVMSSKEATGVSLLEEKGIDDQQVI